MGFPFKPLPGFQNVGANLTAVLPIIPQGNTYEAIHLKMGGTTFNASHVSNIRLRLGGKVIWNVTGSHLDSLNQYFKLTKQAAFLSLFFVNPRAATYEEYMYGAIDTSPIYSDFAMEVDIGGATAPTLQALAEVSAPLPKNSDFRGVFRTLRKAVHAPAAAAEHPLGIPLGSRAGAMIRALHFFHANITQLQFVKDSFYLVDQALNANLQYVQNSNSRSTQSGLLNMDFVLNDFERTSIPTLRKPGEPAVFETKVTVSAADTITSYSDLYETYEAF